MSLLTTNNDTKTEKEIERVREREREQLIMWPCSYRHLSLFFCLVHFHSVGYAECIVGASSRLFDIPQCNVFFFFYYYFLFALFFLIAFVLFVCALLLAYLFIWLVVLACSCFLLFHVGATSTAGSLAAGGAKNRPESALVQYHMID